MYTIIDVNDVEDARRRADIICDTVDDLPTLDEIEANFLAVGSFAYIANERTYKVLNNAKEWV